ncbi:2-methoxy-6-polyprenyl-1,4-benzoquinol methylase, mitochondrial [Homalodisca vitripennis]|uniref:2-methoxy-6-polyprenyl-1,4-benzoquinol methylase, mitochondrial n=1 Tax=Homalodisca vitripennis TaxID=197043 RepID=UPI001EEA57E4|nr:2-methoxy-6-polyprenyl-1,4-benzoquinol methylase, mitochondrial [Homalodisca vitripennis]KAG8291926.1 2-hexaprenyl-6-methoxy-1,4-benzoquinone methyltransferase [Homalodisca vitripennis]
MQLVNFRCVLYKLVAPRTVFKNCKDCRFSTASKSTNEGESEKETHFGFQTVRESEKVQKVYEVFENVANKYDVMNDAMSFFIHRIWKDVFIQRLAPTPGTNLLDVAGGTGDIAFRYLKYLKNLPPSSDLVSPPSSVTVCDINRAMLSVGKERAEKQGYREPEINWLEGDAEKLPVENNTFTAYTIAFGIRNCTHVDKVLDEAYRVLKPGGRFMCLEFSHVNNEVLQWIYDQYSFQMIPVMGQVIAGDWKSYQYLVESIRKFPNQEDFKEMIQSSGFSCVSYENLTFGVVSIHSGFKL